MRRTSSWTSEFLRVPTLIAMLLGVCLLGGGMSTSSTPKKAAADKAVAAKATKVSAAELAALKPSSEQVTGLSQEHTFSKIAGVAENPNSPLYYHVDKVHAVVHPRVPVGDNGSLMKVELATPGKILLVEWYCIGATCGWTYPCTAASCGHGNIEYHGNSATWFAWTNDGNNSEYGFIVHYQ